MRYFKCLRRKAGGSLALVGTNRETLETIYLRSVAGGLNVVIQVNPTGTNCATHIVVPGVAIAAVRVILTNVSGSRTGGIVAFAVY